MPRSPAVQCILGDGTWGRSFDVIVSDVALPDICALDVLTALRRRLVDKPIVLVAAHASDANRRRARALNAVAFLQKPVGVAMLRAAVDEAFREPSDPR